MNDEMYGINHNDMVYGIQIIGNANLPPNTIYCSMDIFHEFEKSTKTKGGILERLIKLYQEEKE